MEIYLDKKHRLLSDEYNMWLEQKISRKNKKTGEKYEDWERISGYHYTWDRVVHSYLNSKCRKSDADTIEKLAKDMDKAIREVAKWDIALIKDARKRGLIEK